MTNHRWPLVVLFAAVLCYLVESWAIRNASYRRLGSRCSRYKPNELPLQIQRQALHPGHHSSASTTALLASFLKSQPTSTSSAEPSLKDIAVPLMNSGKALARTGELIIDFTGVNAPNNESKRLTLASLQSLAAAGAFVRNSGDCIAQAAASCRFKTGAELVMDELREAATCLSTAVQKLQSAVYEAQATANDNDADSDATKNDCNARLATCLEAMIAPVETCSTSLEAAGAALLQQQSLSTVGRHLKVTSQQLDLLSSSLQELSTTSSTDDSATATAATAAAAMVAACELAAQRCRYASEQMGVAAMALVPLRLRQEWQDTV